MFLGLKNADKEFLGAAMSPGIIHNHENRLLDTVL